MKHFSLFLLMFLFNGILNAQIWTPVSPYPSGNGYIDIYMEDSGEGIAVGYSGIISKTSDFGDSFTNIYVDNSAHFTSIHRSANGAFIIVGSQGTILRSENEGLDWEKVPFEDTTYLNTVHFFDGGYGIILGNNGTVLRSVDDGKSWSQMNINSTENLKKFTFVNSNVGFVWSVISDKVYKTFDAGINWVELSLNDNFRINDAHFTNENEGKIFYQITFTHGKLIQTTDGGETWIDTDLSIPSIIEVHFFDELNGIGMSNIGNVYVTNDGGETWEKKEGAFGATPNLKGFHSNLIYVVNPNLFRSTDMWESHQSLVTRVDDRHLKEFAFGKNSEVFIAGEEGLHKSVDGGKNFQKIQDNSIQNLEDVICYGEDNVIVIGQNSTYFQSTDGGVSWENKVLSEEGNYLGMSKVDNTIWVIEEYGPLMRSEDGGETWETIHDFFLNTMYDFPTYITFLNNSVGLMRNKGGEVLRTDNGGLDWETLDVEWIGLKCISFIDEQIGYMSGNGVYKTVDGGANWVLINDATSDCTGLFFRNENIGYYAGTEGKIYKTVDGGLNWTQEISNTFSNLNSIKFNLSGIGLSVGEWRGIVRIEEEPLSESVFNHPVITNNMNVFPNPTTQEINLISENINDKSILHLYNINGHLISEMKGNIAASPIDVRSLSAGTYYLIHSNGELRERGVFVKQ